ncbi:D-alanyl-D-alanine carboxypeptidase family protein [Eubacteriaceae bacterium ES3]|nr:D-alanyl-D-alanine carboxypeptidase family protein [Eubacteriaceae bacterium ES3]
MKNKWFPLLVMAVLWIFSGFVYAEEIINDTTQVSQEVQIQESLPPAICQYRTYVQNAGYQEWVSDGEDGGTTGQGLRLEGIEIVLDTQADLFIEYRTYVENFGWQEKVTDGQFSGTTGQGLRLEGIEIALTGSDSDKYDVYYQVHAQNFGWLDWAKNGESAGSQGLGFRLEGIRILLQEKGVDVPGETDRPYVNGNVKATYQTHVENLGWQEWKSDGSVSGSTGSSLRLEAIRIELDNQGYDLGVSYETQIENIGWQAAKETGELSGTEGLGYRLEAIRMRLTGTYADLYDIYYQVHAQNYGWMDWAKNGDEAGTEGMGYRLEGIRIMVIPKGMPAPGSENLPFLTNRIFAEYRAYVQNTGWQDWRAKGDLSGNTGSDLRLEALQIQVNNSGYDVGIRYQAHVQNIGWQDWSTDGELAGTTGQSYRIESIRLSLTGYDAKMCDLYYAVYTEGFGWLPWVSTGEAAGYEGMSLRLEGIKVVILPKGSSRPANMEQELTSMTRLVNKNHSIPASYEPSDLVVLSLPSTRTTMMRAEAAAALGNLFAAAKNSGLTLYCCSGYRSYQTQASLYQWNVDTFGLAYAELVSARPGMSEHQLGLVMDVTSASVGFDLVESFANTPEGLFVKNNAHKYGFIIRYPEGQTGITGYAYEPWHLRYVGTEVANAIYNSGLTMEGFYGMN